MQENAATTAPTPFWRKHDVAAFLNISPRQVVRLAETGALPGYPLPGMRGWRFRREEIEAVMKRGHHAAPPARTA